MTWKVKEHCIFIGLIGEYLRSGEATCGGRVGESERRSEAASFFKGRERVWIWL